MDTTRTHTHTHAHRIVCVVSHDRTFLDAVCTDILHISGVAKKLTVHKGNYQEFANRRAELQVCPYMCPYMWFVLHPPSRSLSLPLAPFRSLSLPLAHFRSRTHTLSLTRTLSLSHTHILTHRVCKHMDVCGMYMTDTCVYSIYRMHVQTDMHMHLRTQAAYAKTSELREARREKLLEYTRRQGKAYTLSVCLSHFY